MLSTLKVLKFLNAAFLLEKDLKRKATKKVRVTIRKYKKEVIAFRSVRVPRYRLPLRNGLSLMTLPTWQDLP
jgi:hypothetical protein